MTAWCYRADRAIVLLVSPSSCARLSILSVFYPYRVLYEDFRWVCVSGYEPTNSEWIYTRVVLNTTLKENVQGNGLHRHRAARSQYTHVTHTHTAIYVE